MNIFVCETKLKMKESINLEGYDWCGFNRRNQLKSAKCGSGGVEIFVRKDLLKAWQFEILDKTGDEILATCLVNKKTKYKILLVSCYLPPENSNWGYDSDVFFNHLTSMLYSYDDNVDLFIGGGDFNSRIGNLDDHLVDIDDIPVRETLLKTNMVRLL